MCWCTSLSFTASVNGSSLCYSRYIQQKISILINKFNNNNRCRVVLFVTNIIYHRPQFACLPSIFRGRTFLYLLVNVGSYALWTVFLLLFSCQCIIIIFNSSGGSNYIVIMNINNNYYFVVNLYCTYSSDLHFIYMYYSHISTPVIMSREEFVIKFTAKIIFPT